MRGGALNTTAKTLVGGVNELNTKFANYLPLAGGEISGNLSVTGITSLRNTNLTGRLTLIGAAADKPLITRGIFGADSSGGEGDLYLNYNSGTTHGYSIYLGYGAGGRISPNGTFYNGRSAFCCPNWSNRIATKTGGSGAWSWTAPQDCFVYFWVSVNTGTAYSMKINNVDISNATRFAKSGLLPMMAGDVLSCSADNNGYSVYAFGIRTS